MWAIYRAVKRGASPVSILSPKLDSMVVLALRERWEKVSKRTELKSSLIGSVLLLLLSATQIFAQQVNPPLADIKTAAENGDPVAQNKLADAFRARADFATAIVWYRKAAAFGIIDSQYELAHILIQRADWPLHPKDVRAGDGDEALRNFAAAANQGHRQAQIDYGQIQRDGKWTATNYIEAYKWFSLAAASGLEMVPIVTARHYRDDLILKMSGNQIAEGNKRVAAFTTHRPTEAEIPEPTDRKRLRLDGIGGTPNRRFAMLNGTTFMSGESGTIKSEGRKLSARCLAITQTSATFQIEGYDSPKTVAMEK